MKHFYCAYLVFVSRSFTEQIIYSRNKPNTNPSMCIRLTEPIPVVTSSLSLSSQSFLLFCVCLSFFVCPYSASMSFPSSFNLCLSFSDSSETQSNEFCLSCREICLSKVFLAALIDFSQLPFARRQIPLASHKNSEDIILTQKNRIL